MASAASEEEGGDGGLVAVADLHAGTGRLGPEELVSEDRAAMEVTSRNRVEECDDDVDSETAESWRCETIGLDGAGLGSRSGRGEGRCWFIIAGTWKGGDAVTGVDMLAWWRCGDDGAGGKDVAEAEGDDGVWRLMAVHWLSTDGAAPWPAGSCAEGVARDAERAPEGR